MRSISARILPLSSLSEDRSLARYVARVRWGVLVAALLLSLIGLATVHSASSAMAVDYLPRQATWVVLGLLVFAVTFSLDYQMLTKFSVLIYVAALVTLLLVLFLGKEAGGARSWLGVGGYRLQPSEFAKIATALMLARYLAGRNRSILRLDQIMVAGLLTLAPMVLVAMEKDMGSAAMFVPLFVGMLLVAGVPGRYLVVGLLLVLLAGAVMWNFVMLDYQKDRVRTFVSPQEDPLGRGYQLRQSKIAVGSGQLLGRGYGQGTQSQLRFLPARHTDFIFAVLAEEWGFVGVATVMLLYAIYIFNASRIAMRARDRQGILLVVGLLSWFGFHLLYNTAMVVGLLPITGIPLPFLSYGGSFMLVNFMAAGLILGVDFRRHVNR